MDCEQQMLMWEFHAWNVVTSIQYRFQRIKSCRVQWHLDITIAFAELPCNATSVANIYDGKCPSPWSPCFWLFGGSSDESFIIPLFLEACFANLQLRTPKKIKQQLCKIYWTTKSLNWRMWQKNCCTLPWFCFDPWYVFYRCFAVFVSPIWGISCQKDPGVIFQACRRPHGQNYLWNVERTYRYTSYASLLWKFGFGCVRRMVFLQIVGRGWRCYTNSQKKLSFPCRAMKKQLLFEFYSFYHPVFFGFIINQKGSLLQPTNIRERDNIDFYGAIVFNNGVVLAWFFSRSVSEWHRNQRRQAAPSRSKNFCLDAFVCADKPEHWISQNWCMTKIGLFKAKGSFLFVQFWGKFETEHKKPSGGFRDFFTPRNGQMIQLHEHLFQSGSTSNSKSFLFKHTHFSKLNP